MVYWTFFWLDRCFGKFLAAALGILLSAGESNYRLTVKKLIDLVLEIRCLERVLFQHFLTCFAHNELLGGPCCRGKGRRFALSAAPSFACKWPDPDESGFH